LVVERGYQRLPRGRGHWELTGLFPLLLLGDPGSVEEVTGELPQLIGSAGLTSLDPEEPVRSQIVNS
jgi:hypothetical protein